MKKFKINYHIYPYELLIFIGNDIKPVIKSLSKIALESQEELGEYLEGSYQALTIMLRGGQTVIVFKDDSHYQAGVVAHEAFHAVELLFQRLGMPLTKQSSEAYAYLLDYIVSQITNKI